MLSLLVRKSYCALEDARDEAVAELEYMVKAQVRSYTRKDGTVVAAHQDSRQAHPVGTKVRITADRHPDFGKEATVRHIHPNSGIGGATKPAYTLSGIDGPVGHGELEPVHDDPNAMPDHDGYTGEYEREMYGVHFKKGEKVRDNTGTVHTVSQHRGAAVHVEGQWDHFHPSKLRRV